MLNTMMRQFYDSEGLIANARHFLDDHDGYIENRPLIAEVSEERKAIHITLSATRSICWGFYGGLTR